jgi:hypothetical protein
MPTSFLVYYNANIGKIIFAPNFLFEPCCQIKFEVAFYRVSLQPYNLVEK